MKAPVPLAPPAPTRIFFAAALALSTCALLFGLFLLDPLGPRPSGPVRGTHRSGPPSGPRRSVRLDDHIARALDWLARHQHDDGSWGSRSFAGRCPGKHCTGVAAEEIDVAVTALATLAFLEAGPIDREDDRDRVDNALRWLTGAAFTSDDEKGIRGLALATLAFARGGATQADMAGKGSEALLRSRKAGRKDTLTTGWTAEALYAARDAGIPVDEAALGRELLSWLDDVTDAQGRVGDDPKGATSIASQGLNDPYDENEMLGAVGLALRLLAGQDPKSAALGRGVERLSGDLPIWNDTGTSVDFSYWYHGTQALARCRVSQAAVWASWSDRVTRALVDHQRSGECRGGSWDPVDKWGRSGGRVYATAINAITLACVRKNRPTIAPPGRDE